MKFTVRGAMTVSCWTEVEADSPEEALEIAGKREPAGMCWGALYPDADRSWHFENDAEPVDLSVEQ